MNIFDETEQPYSNYLIIHQMWSALLSMEFDDEKKKIREELVNNFCLLLSNTFVFNSTCIKTENALILLIKLVCSLLKLPWVRYTYIYKYKSSGSGQTGSSNM